MVIMAHIDNFCKFVMMLSRQTFSITRKEQKVGTTHKTSRRTIGLADLRNELPAPLKTEHMEDKFHQKPSEENLAYWSEERLKAIDADNDVRLITCDAARRFILLSIVPQAHDDTGEILGAVLTEFDMPPRTH